MALKVKYISRLKTLFYLDPTNRIGKPFKNGILGDFCQFCKNWKMKSDKWLKYGVYRA